MYNLLKEDDSSFDIRHPDGSTFKVAKKGLDKKTIEKIKKFACGGAVKKMADGGDVEELFDPQQSIPESNINDLMASQQSTPSAYDLEMMKKQESIAPTAPVSPYSALLNAKPSEYTPAMMQGQPFGGPDTYFKQYKPMPEDLQKYTQPSIIKPKETEPEPAPAKKESIAKYEPQEEQPRQLQQPSYGGGGAGQFIREQKVSEPFKEGYELMKGAATAKAEVAKKEMADRQLILQQQAERQEAARRDFEARMADINGKRDAIAEDIKKAKIDPNKYWHDKSVPSKIAGIFAMGLGGFAASRTGGRNLVADMIDKQIDRDIEAQRADLNKKQTILGNYMKMGYDAQDAYKLAAADARDRVATQLEMIASKYGDEKANADMLNTIGALKNKSMQETIDVNHRQSQLDIQKGQLGLQRQELGLKAQQMGLQMGTLQQRQNIVERILGGEKVSIPRSLVRDPELREIMTEDPSGATRLANSPEDRKKMDTATIGFKEGSEAIDQLKQLQKDAKRGVNPWSTNQALAEKLMQKALFSAVEAKGLSISQIPASDLEMIKHSVPDPTSWNTGKFEAKLKQWEDDLNSNYNASQRQYLQKPVLKRR